jgi:hypothetical protein
MMNCFHRILYGLYVLISIETFAIFLPHKMKASLSFCFQSLLFLKMSLFDKCYEKRGLFLYFIY